VSVAAKKTQICLKETEEAVFCQSVSVAIFSKKKIFCSRIFFEKTSV
jgi:hypothetical protein